MKNTFDWAVIGAGPAGIAAVGKLIDRRKTPVFEQYDGIQYVDTKGIIAPGLFGVGVVL